MSAAFKNAGHQIVQVYSRDIQHAQLLAYHVKAEAVDKLSRVNAETDIFIIAVKDDAIPVVAQQLAVYNKLIVHTAGNTSLAALKQYAAASGVFYPLQTFSKVKEIDFSTVPLCIEGASPEIELTLTELAGTISNRVYKINAEQRRQLHLAAVFACNFPNYLYYIAQQILDKQKIGFDILKPLIKETADKVQNYLPAQVQTGPAIRNDENTMEEHLDLLSNEPALMQIYTLLSQGIIKMDKRSNGAR